MDWRETLGRQTLQILTRFFWQNFWQILFFEDCRHILWSLFTFWAHSRETPIWRICFEKKARGYPLGGKIAFMAFLSTSYDLMNMSSIFYVLCAYLDPVIYNVYIYFLLFFVIRFTYLCLCITFPIYIFFQKLNQKILTELPDLLWVFILSLLHMSVYVSPHTYQAKSLGGLMVCALSYTGATWNVQCCWTSNLFHVMLVHIQFACDHLIHWISHITSCEMRSYGFTSFFFFFFTGFAISAFCLLYSWKPVKVKLN